MTITTLLKADFRRLFNTFARNAGSESVKGTVLATITLLFVWIEYEVSFLLIRHIWDQKFLHELRMILLAKLLYLVFLIFSVLLVYSNIVMAISIFFMSPELDLIHARPVSKATLFFYRFLEVFLRSSWMFFAFGIPILAAYGNVMGFSGRYYFQILKTVFPITLGSTSIGISIAVLLILFFSPRRAKQALLVVGIAASAGLVLIFRWMRPEQLVDPIGVEQLTFYIKAMRMPTIAWLPTTWAAESIASFGTGSRQLILKYNLYLWSTALGMFLLSYFIFAKVWWRARSGGRGNELDVADRAKRKLYRRKSSNRFRMTFFYRDVLLFIRDAGQWSQLIIIAALIAIYVYNFKNLPYELFTIQFSMAFTSVGASALILTALLARFGFPAVSMEGGKIWLLKSSPIAWNRYLWHRFFFYFFPALVIGMLLVGFSLIILDVPRFLMVKCLVLIFLLTFGCTGLSVGLGALHPRFDLDEPAMVAVSTGGLVYMLSALAFIGIAIIIAIIPDVVSYFSLYWGALRFLKRIDYASSVVIISIITYFVTMIPMRLGIAHLQKPLG